MSHTHTCTQFKSKLRRRCSPAYCQRSQTLGRAILNFTWRHMAAYIIIYIISYHIAYMRFDDDWWTTAAHHPPVDSSSQPTVILHINEYELQHTHFPSGSSPRLNIDNPRRPVRRCLRPNIIIFRLQPAPSIPPPSPPRPSVYIIISIRFRRIIPSSSRNTQRSIVPTAAAVDGGRWEKWLPKIKFPAPADRIYTLFIYLYDDVYDIQIWNVHTHTLIHHSYTSSLSPANSAGVVYVRDSNSHY